MNIHASKNGWKLLYFDGFEDSGFIKKGKKENQRLIVRAAKRILEIETPRPFELFYFVAKDLGNANSLRESPGLQFPEKNVHIVNTDCNEKIVSMSQFLASPKGKKYKALAYIDPCSMQFKWS